MNHSKALRFNTPELPQRLVWFRRIGETDLQWDVVDRLLQQFVSSPRPSEEIAVPPTPPFLFPHPNAAMGSFQSQHTQRL